MAVAKKLIHALGMFAFCLMLPSSDARCVTFREFPIGNGLSIIPGPGGDLWLTQQSFDGVARISVSGEYSSVYAVSALEGSRPSDLAVGSDGNLWVTDAGRNSILRITPAGVWTELAIPAADLSPRSITEGADGRLWFTASGKIGSITKKGIFAEFSIPTATPFANVITKGPDGNLWFTESRADKIGRITTDGIIAEYSLPRTGSWPFWITPGPDGHLWFTESFVNRIGRISLSGSIMEFELPRLAARPMGIVQGPDGNMWYADASGRIGRITPKGVVSEFIVPIPEGRPSGITFGPDGNLWFLYNLQSFATRMTLGGTPINGPCVPTETALCIDDQAGDRRFKVEAEYASEQAGGISGHGKAIPLASLGVGRGGLFWFFSQDNPELIVKILNGCANNGKFWVFISGGTNVGMTITVSDTVTGEVHSYYNRDLTPFAPVQDVNALSCGV